MKWVYKDRRIVRRFALLPTKIYSETEYKWYVLWLCFYYAYQERNTIGFFNTQYLVDKKAWLNWKNDTKGKITFHKCVECDRVEVVRCKDCIYNENGCCTQSAEYDDTQYRPEYFCADGERREA